MNGTSLSIGFGIIRMDPDGSADIPDCAVEGILVALYDAAVAVSVGIISVQSDRLGEIREGLI
jgi:hypothetical protein